MMKINLSVPALMLALSAPAFSQASPAPQSTVTQPSPSGTPVKLSELDATRMELYSERFKSAQEKLNQINQEATTLIRDIEKRYDATYNPQTGQFVTNPAATKK